MKSRREIIRLPDNLLIGTSTYDSQLEFQIQTVSKYFHRKKSNSKNAL